MKCNAAGIKIIEDSESCQLKVYLCPARIPTIGWGHTGPDVYIGMKPILTSKAVDLLYVDIACAERQVEHSVQAPLNQNEFSALVSLCFNIGVGRFAHADIVKYLNAGDKAKAAAEFLLWTHSCGQELPGLVTRRRKERDLFLTPA